MPRPPKTLVEKINIGLYLYPCDLLFVHRDAEKQPRETRRREITAAVSKMSNASQIPPAVCVIPVRMQEAWLLFDEGALRQAAGNPHGKQSLQLPPLVKLERLPDPKALLHELLRVASGLHGRRLKQFSTMQSAQRVTALIEDFSLLGKLPAFSAVESDLRDVIKAQRWSLLAAE
jgi:hypothetical protein